MGDGLIGAVPNKGAFVRKLTTDEMNEMYDARLMMELFGLHDLSMPLPTEDRKMLVSVLDRSEAAFELKKMDEYLASDFALHKSIVALRHNDYISGMYESLHWQLYVVLLESDWPCRGFTT